MSEGEEDGRRRVKRGLFGRKKKRTNNGDGNSIRTNSLDGDSTTVASGDRHRRKRGLGRKIRRLVVGRNKKSKRPASISNVEVFDKNDPNYKGPRTALDADTMAQILSKDEPQNPYIAAGRFGDLDGVEEEDEEDSDKDDMISYGDAEEHDDDMSDQGELVGPLELVLVLVDPRSLRFELLQLEFETPQLSNVGEALEQIQDIVTESSIKSLQFHSVLDRKGNFFPAKSPLGKALKSRRRQKDILVGISNGVSPEKAGRLARPILGDAKVISMLEENGHSVKGWAKDKKEQSELKDTTKDSFAVAERKRQLKLTTLLLGTIVVAGLLFKLYKYLLGDDPIESGLAAALNHTAAVIDDAIETAVNNTELHLEQVFAEAQTEVAQDA